MTTARSPLSKLKKQASEISAILKEVERGGDVGDLDPDDKLGRARREKPSIEVAVVMDDKILKIELTWAAVRDTTEAGLTEFILGRMSARRRPLNV